MKIHDTEGFPNPARVRIALAEKGALDKVTFVPVDVMQGEHRSAAFLRRNPDATVPVLELDDGSHISQCTAITEYIDGAFEGICLCGSDARERSQIHMMNRRVEAGLLDAVGDYFHHATPGLGPDLETQQVPDWGHQRKQTASRTMVYLDDLLSRNEYVAGDAFSMADITAYAGLAFADFAKVEIPEKLNRLVDWRTRMSQRPSMA